LRQQLAGAFSKPGGGRPEEPVTADLLKAFGEGMLEKACDETVDGKGQPPGLVSARGGVAEGDAAVLEGFDAIVGDRDAMGIAGKVLGGVLAVAGVLEMDVPGFAEDRRIDLIEEAGAVEGVADLGAEDLGQGVARDEESGMSWLAPSLSVLGQATGGDEEVDVGVIGEIA
jgi:hypothetical protein